MDEDAILIERFRRGSRQAFDELVCKYRHDIYRLACRMLANPEDAEEVTQQAFVNAFNGLHGFRQGAAFKTWLYRIAVNLANSHLRARPRTEELLDDTLPQGPPAATPLDETLRRETLTEAVAALSELGEKQRTVVTLRLFHELTYSEIGRIAGCSEATAKVHFHYGIENLRKKMTGHGL